MQINLNAVNPRFTPTPMAQMPLIGNTPMGQSFLQGGPSTNFLYQLMQLMQMMQMMQSGWGSFGGGMPNGQLAPLRGTSPASSGMTATPAAARPATRPTSSAGGPRAGGSTPIDPQQAADFRAKNAQRMMDRAQTGWPQVFPEAHVNPNGLMMITAKEHRAPGEEARKVPFDPSVPLDQVHLYHDVGTKMDPYLTVNRDLHFEKYWNEARTPNGIDYSKLSHKGRGTGFLTGEHFNSSQLKTIAIDMTASEIFPGKRAARSSGRSFDKKSSHNLSFAYHRLNSSGGHNLSEQEKQNHHEAAKFAFATANFLEHGGDISTEALDQFLEDLEADEITSSTADGPRGLELAKLEKVSEAILEGEIEIEDVVEAGVIAEGDAKKFETSVQAIDRGEIKVDVSKITNESSDADVKSTIIDATKTRQKDNKDYATDNKAALRRHRDSKKTPVRRGSVKKN